MAVVDDGMVRDEGCVRECSGGRRDARWYRGRDWREKWEGAVREEIGNR